MFSFSEKKFDPNFADFITYVFNKMIDIDNYEENKNKDNKINEINLEKKEENEISTELESIEEAINLLDLYKCIICKGKPIDPFKCELCNSFICNQCYLEQFNCNDIVNCVKCSYTIFTECSKEEKDFITDCLYQTSIVDNNSLAQKENNDNINENKIIEEKNYENKIQNELSNESKNLINEYCEEFKNDMLKILDKKFNDFNQKQTEQIYTQLLEIYIQKAKNENQDISEALKTKDEIKNEATNQIRQNLKEQAEELFLKKSSGILYQHIIEIFKTEMLNKINNLTENIEENEQIQEVFKKMKILEPSKNLEEQFKKYILFPNLERE
jgi:hypothetical protein